MKPPRLLIIGVLFVSPLLRAQSTASQLQAILQNDLQSTAVVDFQLQEYLMKRAPKLPSPATAEEWTREEQQIRKRVLENVVFHGWPDAWVHSQPRFEEVGIVASGKGYRLRKFRYEVVPGFYSTALLYEPENPHGKAPAVLDVMGHFSQTGKAEAFQQKLCINQALRGMVALNLEWLGMGEMFDKLNTHGFGGDLDLVGANAVGLFYLAMRRGLDYLWQDPGVDQSRIAVTGLSGGGWQTIILSSLDDRVNISIPVAGYTSLEGRLALAPVPEAGDIEQNATDLLVGQDYPTLTAIRAPRPTLEIFNAEDDCCFRASMVKPYIFDAVRPFYHLYGKDDAFQFHENTDISAHNYGLDDRQQAYQFLDKYFGLPSSNQEIDVANDVKGFSELAAGLPPGNLTIVGLARKMAAGIDRPEIPSGASARTAWTEANRRKLQEGLRYQPVTVQHAWAVGNTHHNGVESLSFRFLLSNGLSATAVWLRNVSTPDRAPLSIMINDQGKKAAAEQVWDRIPVIADHMDRGEQVLVLDLLFTGDAAPGGSIFFVFPEMLAAAGSRPLGLEAAQLIAVANWGRERWQASSLSLQSTGIRSQMEALTASALAPTLFSEVSVRGGMRSLRYLLDAPVDYMKYADLFCLDLYKDFDLDRLAALAELAKVHAVEFVEDQSKQER